MEFPNEILLHIFSVLPLIPLIAAQGVDRKWRRLVAAADVLPLRRELFDLYLTVIDSPWFLETRPWLLKNLQPFDRQAYIAALQKQYFPLPEAFALWILEWPARAIIGGIWPGLPWDHMKDGDVDGVQVLRGVNWLEPTTVQVSAITFTSTCKRQYDFIPAILIRSDFTNVWLILDDDEQKGTVKLQDKVFSLYARGHHLYTEKGDFGPGYDVVDNDWIAFQRRTWDEVGARANSGSRLCYATRYHRRSKPRYDRIGVPSWRTICTSPIPWLNVNFDALRGRLPW